VLLAPVVLAAKAFVPNALLSDPVVLLTKVLNPKAPPKDAVVFEPKEP
jgi:hypothetical protein